MNENNPTGEAQSEVNFQPTQDISLPTNTPPHPKKNKGLIIGIIAVSLLVVGLGGYLIYDKVIKSPDSGEQQGSNNESSDPNINNETVAMLLSDYVPFFNMEGSSSNVYINRKVTFEDIPHTAILNVALNAVNMRDRNSHCVPDVTEDDIRQSLGEDYVDYHRHLIESGNCILASDLQQVIKEMYNQDDFQVPSSFPTPGCFALVFKGKMYTYCGLGSYGKYRETVDYEYEVINGELHIHERMFLIEHYHDETRHYTDELSEPFITTFAGASWNVNQELLKTYTHVFRKNASGGYYWHSTEPKR
jgi:hypothetical protein